MDPLQIEDLSMKTEGVFVCFLGWRGYPNCCAVVADFFFVEVFFSVRVWLSLCIYVDTFLIIQFGHILWA